MALKLNERYPGRFNNPSADYPQGAFKNRTSPTAKDGSYLEQDWANDKEGFFQSLISVAGVVPSGVADKVGTSQYYDALLTVLYAAARKAPILNDTGTAGAYAAANTPALTALPATGYMQRVKISNLNPGASTYAPDGLAAKPVYGLGLQPLQGGELPAGIASLMYLVQAGVNGGNGAWVIIESLGGSQQIPAATKSQHAMQLGQATGRLLRTTVYRNNAGTLQSSVDGAAFTTASVTFTASAATTATEVETQGGGGAGGAALPTAAAQNSNGAGGGAGGYAKSRFTSGFSGVTVAVGLGGVGSNVAGTNGGTTSFGALMSSTGGFGAAAGGPQSTSISVPGGSANGGTSTGGNIINASGEPGKYGFYCTQNVSGTGGDSVFGGGAPSVAGASSGVTAVSPGAGGSGGTVSAGLGSTTASGGSGAGGLLIVKEFA